MTGSTRLHRATTTTATHRLGSTPDSVWLPLGSAVALALLLLAVSTWAQTQLGPFTTRQPPLAITRAYEWLHAWSWQDGAWYVDIARRGYHFVEGRQSAVAFFPAYPLLVRGVSRVVGDAVLAGFLATLACGIAATVLFHRWVVEKLGPTGARWSLAAFLLYPCSFYLFGAIYADALFLLAVLAAFPLVEHDRPILAGIAGAVATATRPVGLAVVVGLWALAVQRRGGLRRLRRCDAGLVLVPAGALLYAAFLWIRFGTPLAFVRAEEGWKQAPGVATWLKLEWFRALGRMDWFDPRVPHLIGHATVTVAALALLPAVFRRFGRAYGIYTAAFVIGCALSTSNFVGLGRYVLAAFPLFALAGDVLTRRSALRVAVLALSGVLLIAFTQFHARNLLIS